MPKTIHTIERRQQARRAYEYQGLSLVEIGRIQGISPKTLESWLKKEGWQKGGEKDRVYETVVERNLRLFAEQGCTPEHVAKVMVKNINEQITNLKEIGTFLISAGLSAEQVKEAIDLVKGYAGNKQVALSYIQEYNRMIGNLAPQKREVTGKDGGPIAFSGMFKDVSDEELQQITEKYFRRYAMLTGKAEEEKQPWSDLL